MAEVYIKDKIAAPLYRLPTKAYQASLPQLLTDANTNEHELRAIQQFYMEVESLNRGLDQAELARDDNERLNNEYSRNYSKAEKLTPTGLLLTVTLLKHINSYKEGVVKFEKNT